jgi:hypothetical protein
MNVVSLLTGMISECATLRIKQSAYYFWKVRRFEFDVFQDSELQTLLNSLAGPSGFAEGVIMIIDSLFIFASGK